MVKRFMNKQQYPEPCVGALILNPKGEIFLMKSYKWRNKYTIPGGRVELGETLTSALKREVEEETGLSVFDIKPLGIQEFIFGKEYWKKKHYLFFDYVCRTKLTKVKLNDEGQEYIWIKPKESLKLPVEPYARKAVKVFLRKMSGVTPGVNPWG